MRKYRKRILLAAATVVFFGVRSFGEDGSVIVLEFLSNLHIVAK